MGVNSQHACKLSLRACLIGHCSTRHSNRWLSELMTKGTEAERNYMVEHHRAWQLEVWLSTLQYCTLSKGLCVDDNTNIAWTTLCFEHSKPMRPVGAPMLPKHCMYLL